MASVIYKDERVLPVRASAKVLIGFPTTGLWSDQFGMALCNMCISTMQRRPDIELAVLNEKSSMLWVTRQHLCEVAVEHGFSHILFIDTDQSFPSSLLARLLSHERAVVACNIATKVEAPHTQETAVTAYDPSTRITTGCERTTGLERVWRVGTGVMLIRTTVFKDIVKPWFPVTWLADEQRWVGEDWGFCEKLEKANIPIWVDHDASALVGHWGQKNFTLARYEQTQGDRPLIIDPRKEATRLVEV